MIDFDWTANIYDLVFPNYDWNGPQTFKYIVIVTGFVPNMPEFVTHLTKYMSYIRPDMQKDNFFFTQTSFQYFFINITGLMIYISIDGHDEYMSMIDEIGWGFDIFNFFFVL